MASPTSDRGELDLSPEHITACVRIVMRMPIEQFKAAAHMLGIPFAGYSRWEW